MSDQTNDQLVDQSDSFFEEPALLVGEDRTKTLDMLTAVAEHVRPEDVFERMMVNDTANYYREEMRFRRISAALIESAKPEALEVLLRPFFEQGTIITDGPSEIAKGYFNGDHKQREAMASIVARCGIEEGHIEAKATQLVIATLLVLDRMGSNREKPRRILRKEHELRRKERAKKNAAA